MNHIKNRAMNRRPKTVLPVIVNLVVVVFMAMRDKGYIVYV